MNAFDRKLQEHGYYPLRAENVSTLQVNIGYKCNLRCTHCHVEASPERDEQMPLSVISRVIEIADSHPQIKTIDITGGSPEMNPYFKYLVQSCSNGRREVIVLSNLAIYSEDGFEEIPEFLASQKVHIIASLPCYTEEGVDTQRGKGTYRKAVSALKKLNLLGYGQNDSGLRLDIMFNPAGAAIAPDQKGLEEAYRSKLGEMHGIVFNNLIALSNMPIGRLGKQLSEDDHTHYVKTLLEKFNPTTVKNLMCRHLVSVSPQGALHDCDFWQMMRLPVRCKSKDLDSFDYEELVRREIVTNALCLMCTAGAGASCSGALA